MKAGCRDAPGFSREQSATIPLILQESADATCAQPRDPPPPIVFTCQFRRNKGEYVWLFRGTEPGLPRWEFDVTSTMLHVNVTLQISQIW